MYPRYRPGAYGGMSPDREGLFVDVRDFADDLREVLRVFYASATLSEESVGAAEKLSALVEPAGDRSPAREIPVFEGTRAALDALSVRKDS